MPRLNTIALMLLLALAFTGCSDDDNNPVIPNDDPIYEITKVSIESLHDYSINLSGEITIGDNTTNTAPGIFVYYDDSYQTKWDVLEVGSTLSFTQNNWPYFFAGLPRVTQEQIDRLEGSFQLNISSQNGGTNSTVEIGQESCFLIGDKLSEISVTSHHNYTLSLTGSMEIGDNGNNVADGIIVYYDDSYSTKWAVLRPGETLSFLQNNWPQIYIGIPRVTQEQIDRATGGFQLEISSGDGGTNTNVVIDKNFCFLMLD